MPFKALTGISGTLKNKKSVNVPNVHLNIPPLTERDIEYIHFAIERVQNTDQMISSAINSLVEDRHLADDDLVVILAPTYGSKTGANFIEIASVAQCMNNQRKAMEIPDTY